MPSQQEIAEQQELLTTYRRTLAHLLRQAAKHGGEPYAPPNVANGIQDARENIARIKGILRGWDVAVDDSPDDEAPHPAEPRSVLAAARRQPRALVVWHGVAGTILALLVGLIVWLAHRPALVTIQPTLAPQP